MPAAAQGGDDRTAPTRVRSSGPGQDQPPRIDPWAVSIANVLDGDAGEQEPEQFTTLCHGPGRPGSRQVEERLPQNGVGVFPVLGESLAGSSETVAGQRFSTVSVQVIPVGAGPCQDLGDLKFGLSSVAARTSR